MKEVIAANEHRLNEQEKRAVVDDLLMEIFTPQSETLLSRDAMSLLEAYPKPDLSQEERSRLSQIIALSTDRMRLNEARLRALLRRFEQEDELPELSKEDIDLINAADADAWSDSLRNCIGQAIAKARHSRNIEIDELDEETGEVEES